MMPAPGLRCAPRPALFQIILILVSVRTRRGVSSIFFAKGPRCA
jgi:hypothetical protein